MNFRKMTEANVTILTLTAMFPDHWPPKSSLTVLTSKAIFHGKWQTLDFAMNAKSVIEIK